MAREKRKRGMAREKRKRERERVCLRFFLKVSHVRREPRKEMKEK